MEYPPLIIFRREDELHECVPKGLQMVIVPDTSPMIVHTKLYDSVRAAFEADHQQQEAEQ